ncbi:AMP-binding protein [Thalassotalea fusca]
MRLNYKEVLELSPVQTFERALNNKDKGIVFYQSNLKDNQYFSFYTLASMAREHAKTLAEMGIKRGDKVLLSAENSSRFVLSWFALLLVGATPVPTPPSATLAGDNAYLNRMLPLLSYHRWFIGGESDWQQWRSHAEGEYVQFISLNEFVELPESLRDCETPVRFPHVEFDDTAFIQYTSGSTNTPKGLVISYQNIIANTTAIADGISLSGDDLCLSWLPVYHDYGLICNFMLSLLQGCHYVMCVPLSFVKRPLRFLQLVKKHRATFICMPNFAVELINKALAEKPILDGSIDLTSLKWLSIGAEPISIDSLNRAYTNLAPFGLAEGVIAPSYGLAEATVGVAIVRPGQVFATHKLEHQQFVLNGHLVSGFSIDIRNPDNLGYGDIYLRGDSVAKFAYVNGTLQPITDDKGYVHTKDVGKLVNDQLVIAGRADEMVCVRGENLFPYDLEAAVRLMPMVGARRVAAFFVNQSAPQAVIVFETREQNPRVLAEWRDSIREKIASNFALPVLDILAVPTKSIPVTTSGKIQRTKARRMYEQGLFSIINQSKDEILL